MHDAWSYKKQQSAEASATGAAQFTIPKSESRKMQKMWFRYRRKCFLLLSLTFLSLLYILLLQKSPPPPPSSSKKHPRDIHVVIGYYQGNNLWNYAGDNLTQEILNTRSFSEADPGAGVDGQAVIIPSFESPKMSKLFQINRFNVMASDRIPLDRPLPDVRKGDCKTKVYDEALPSTSVIIVFHNEAWSTLLRTVHSVVNRTPWNYLREVILVDDASQRDFLKKPLEDEVKGLRVPVKVVRSKRRVGLIRARLLGASMSTGKVLTFLDAHCEATEGWIQPLLQRIKLNRKAIVSPVIDIINDDTFQYIRSFELHQGGFNWELHFRWFSLPLELIEKRGRDGDGTEPFLTPVMAGGLFAMDKDYFYELGGYDEKMEVWGGENLEISLRGWMCGATLEIVPCSHVGHLFRKSSPYTFPNGVGSTLNSNLARVALVWLDEWKDFYFKLHPEVAAFGNQSIAERVELRRRMKCKPFSWFLKNVWPHHFFPMGNRFFGKIRNVKAQKCLESPRTKTFGQPYGPAKLSDCILELYSPQLFVISEEGYFRTDDNVCLDSIELQEKSQVRIMACNTLKRQQWKVVGKSVVHKSSGKCLDLADKGEGLVVGECLDGSRSQQWEMERQEWRNLPK